MAPISHASQTTQRGHFWRWSGPGLGLALLLIVAAALVGIWTLYLNERRAVVETEMADATETAENIAQAVEESTISRVQAIDRVLMAFRQSYRSGGPAAAVQTIRALDFPRDVISNYVITDRTGQVTFIEPPISEAMPFLGDRPHMNVHFARKTDELFIGVPVFGGVARQWISVFTRPLLDPDGTVTGVVGVTVNPFFLSKVYDSFNLGPASAIELIGLDGVVRSRSVLTEEILSTSIAPDMNALLASKGRGVAMQVSALDGVRRLTAVRKVKDLPLLVVVGTAEAHILSRTSAPHAALTLEAAIGSVLVLLLAMTIRLERRSAAARRELRARSIDLDNANRQLREQVAERTASETRLRDATELLRAVVDASPVPIFCVARDQTISIWNRAAENAFGWTASEMLSHPVDKRMLLDPNGTSPSLSERVMAGEEIRDLEIRRRHKDGHALIINAAADRVRDQNGETLGLVFVWEDITLRRRMEHQLSQAQKMEAVGQLSGGVAHDFNNLLGVIVGNLDMVTDEPAMSETTHSMITAALDAALRGSDLVQRLLAFSRRQMLQPSLIDAKTVVADLIPLLQRTLGEEIQIANLAEGGEAIVNADRAQLEAALVNLAVNARDAMPGGGRLTFAVDLIVIDADAAQSIPELAIPELKPGRHVTIRVTDTGDGIAPDVLPRVFEPFFSTKETGKGSGLGLSMVYGFISQSGGTVRIQSELGQGTVVTLYLPIAEPAANDLHPPAIAGTAELPRGTERILIVEDNVDMRRVGVGILTGLGYQVTEVGTPAEALSLMEGGEVFDLVFTDVTMPGGLSGFDLLREVQTRWPGMRTLVASGSARANERSGLESVVMAKPYRKAELARQIRTALDAVRDKFNHAIASDD